jgi:hypothetical protein
MPRKVTSGDISETADLFHASNFIEQPRGMLENARRRKACLPIV